MKLTDQELTAQEMVDWANANMERVEELEAKIERLELTIVELNTDNDANCETARYFKTVSERLRAERRYNQCAEKETFLAGWDHYNMSRSRMDMPRDRIGAYRFWSKALAVEDKI